MRLVTKLASAGLIVVATAAAAVAIKRRARKRNPPHLSAHEDAADEDLGIPVDLGAPGAPDDELEIVEDVTVIATSSGIADVDPEPLAQTAGEGIALEPNAAAHTEIKALRERLPHPGVPQPDAPPPGAPQPGKDA